MPELLDLITGDRTGLHIGNVHDYAHRSATGAQFHVVSDASGRQLDAWFKEIVVPTGGRRLDQRTHLVEFAKYVRTTLVAQVGQPSARLPTFFTHFARYQPSEPGRGFGVVMPRVRGEPLRELGVRALAQFSLAQKLHLALDLATGVAILHRYGMVHADLNDKNVLVDTSDPERPRAYIIDFDGAGILDGSASPKFRRNLRPRVRGTKDGSYMAPELRQNNQRTHRHETDCWDLAVALHAILFRKQDPMRLLPVPGHRWVETPHSWPHWPTGKLSLFAAEHRACYTALSPRLQQHFVRVFSRPRGGAFDPAARPGADQWARDLFVAWQHVERCTNPGCDREYVAVGRDHCPFCASREPRRWEFETVV